MSRLILIALAIVVIIIVIAVFVYLVISFNGNKNTANDFIREFEIQGMKVQVLKEGSGEETKSGDRITTHYVVWLEDGSKLESSIDKNQPYPFNLGQNKVIKGWDLGLMDMKVGEKRRLIIPPHLAYGPGGVPPKVPPSATLTYEVELLKVEN